MTKRLIIFVLAAALLFPIGCVGAQMAWYRFHHRYDVPQTGLYNGYVSVVFDCFDEPFYDLSFTSETAPHWYWRQPTNFCYTTLQVHWREWWRDDSADRQAAVSLPAFTYTAGETTGPFTRDILASWLFGPTNQISEADQANEIYGYFEAAARGFLPPPRHHTYYLEQPVHVCVQHFLLGCGVGSTVYIWLTVWLLLVVFVGRKILRRSHGG